MAKGEFGFIHGAPENLNKTWEKQIRDRTFSFKKLQKRKGLFLYNCQCHNEHGHFIGASSTGFYSERDLTPTEVEALPQCADFIDGCTRTEEFVAKQQRTSRLRGWRFLLPQLILKESGRPSTPFRRTFGFFENQSRSCSIFWSACGNAR
jgi:hypothetical protein